jgi:hypothetical protein
LGTAAGAGKNGVDPRNVIAEFNPIWCAEGDCPIRTYLTLVPCSQDFENQIPGEVTVQFRIVNELEQIFSASTTVECWLHIRLADIDAPTGRCTADPTNTCITDDECIQDNDGFCNKNSVFSTAVLGTGTAFTTISPVDLDGGVIGVAEEAHFNQFRSMDVQRTNRAEAAWNLQQAVLPFSNRYDATINEPGGPVIDRVTVPVGF